MKLREIQKLFKISRTSLVFQTDFGSPYATRRNNKTKSLKYPLYSALQSDIKEQPLSISTRSLPEPRYRLLYEINIALYSLLTITQLLIPLACDSVHCSLYISLFLLLWTCGGQPYICYKNSLHFIVYCYKAEEIRPKIPA